MTLGETAHASLCPPGDLMDGSSAEPAQLCMRYLPADIRLQLLPHTVHEESVICDRRLELSRLPACDRVPASRQLGRSHAQRESILARPPGPVPGRCRSRGRGLGKRAPWQRAAGPGTVASAAPGPAFPAQGTGRSPPARAPRYRHLMHLGDERRAIWMSTRHSLECRLGGESNTAACG